MKPRAVNLQTHCARTDVLKSREPTYLRAPKRGEGDLSFRRAQYTCARKIRLARETRIYLVSRARRICARTYNARAEKRGGGKIRLVYLDRFLCVKGM